MVFAAKGPFLRIALATDVYEEKKDENAVDSSYKRGRPSEPNPLDTSPAEGWAHKGSKREGSSMEIRLPESKCGLEYARNASVGLKTIIVTVGPKMK